MSTDLQRTSLFTASLTVQISEAERRLREQRRLVQVHSTTLGRTLRHRLTDPVLLLWAGSLGFLMGELTQRQMPKSPSRECSPDAGHPFLKTALRVLQTVTWAHTLLTALLDTKTLPVSPLDASD